MGFDIEKTLVVSDVDPERMDELLGVKVAEGPGVTGDLEELVRLFNSMYSEFVPKVSSRGGVVHTPKDMETYELSETSQASNDPKKIIPILFIFERVTTTQKALEAIVEGCRKSGIKLPLLSSVLAVTQTNGMGFHDRKWKSDIMGNLHASVFSNILGSMNKLDEEAMDKKMNENVSLMLPMIISKLLADSLKKMLGRDEIFGKEEGLIIRPINDIMLEFRKKLAGVLIHSSVSGIGVNFKNVPVDEDFESKCITNQTASIDEVVKKFAIENKISPYLLLREFCARMKGFADELSGCGDVAHVSLLLRRTFQEYKAYFHEALVGKNIEVYGPDHMTLLASGEYSDVERFPRHAVRVTTPRGEETVPLGGIKII